MDESELEREWNGLFMARWLRRIECRSCGESTIRSDDKTEMHVTNFEEARPIDKIVHSNLLSFLEKRCDYCGDPNLIGDSELDGAIAIDSLRDPPEVLHITTDVFLWNEQGVYDRNPTPVLWDDKTEINLTSALDPQTAKLVGELRYRITGVILHQGDNPSAGHYVALTTTDWKTWHLCNDSIVQPMTFEEFRGTRYFNEFTGYSYVFVRVPEDGEMETLAVASGNLDKHLQYQALLEDRDRYRALYESGAKPSDVNNIQPAKIQKFVDALKDCTEAYSQLVLKFDVAKKAEKKRRKECDQLKKRLQAAEEELEILKSGTQPQAAPATNIVEDAVFRQTIIHLQERVQRLQNMAQRAEMEESRMRRQLNQVNLEDQNREQDLQDRLEQANTTLREEKRNNRVVKGKLDELEVERDRLREERDQLEEERNNLQTELNKVQRDLTACLERENVSGLEHSDTSETSEELPPITSKKTKVAKTTSSKKVAAGKVAQSKKTATDKVTKSKKTAAGKVTKSKKTPTGEVAQSKKAATSKVAQSKRTAASKVTKSKNTTPGNFGSSSGTDTDNPDTENETAAAGGDVKKKTTTAGKVGKSKKKTTGKVTNPKKTTANNLNVLLNKTAGGKVTKPGKKKKTAGKVIKSTKIEGGKGIKSKDPT